MATSLWHNAASETAPELSSHPALAPASWLDALWEEWVRTRDIHQAAWRDHASKYSEGYADAIYDLLKDVKRAECCAPLAGSAAGDESEVRALKTKIAGWAWSLPEHPQWQWLRQEMLDVAGTQPPNGKVSDR